MSEVVEIRLSGTGGQGLILAGIILAEAALGDGKNAVQSQSYGPEARGGASKSEVIISSGEIYYPKVTRPGIFLALSQEAFDMYIQGVRDDGVAIIDSSISPDSVRSRGPRVISVPILSTAEDKLNKPMVANIIALSVIMGMTGVVSREALQHAVLSRVPKGTEELNILAIDEGLKLAASLS